MQTSRTVEKRLVENLINNSDYLLFCNSGLGVKYRSDDGMLIMSMNQRTLTIYKQDRPILEIEDVDMFSHVYGKRTLLVRRNKLIMATLSINDDGTIKSEEQDVMLLTNPVKLPGYIIHRNN